MMLIDAPTLGVCLGFTGTRAGMTNEQKARVSQHVLPWAALNLFAVHGDCLGADSDFDSICMQLGLRRGIFPCNINRMRAWCGTRTPPAIDLASPAPPLQRNGWIALACNRLIATPQHTQNAPLHKGGTWNCVRQAQALGRQVMVVWPDGSETLQ